MTIYKRSFTYRRVYEQHHGPIPKDEHGRTFEIHHIDGDHTNDNPSNLKAISIQEHFDIHYSQGDWGACHAMAIRMKQSPEFLKELSQQRIANGTHNFLGGEIQRKQIADGRHPFIDTNFKLRPDPNRINPNNIIVICPHCGKTGSKPAMVKSHFDNCSLVNPVTCQHCGKVGSKGGMTAWHFDRCKHRKI